MSDAALAAMVERQIARRGVNNTLVLEAMKGVDRQAFVPHDLVEFAYDDTPLPIDEAQTISQPYIVALMVDALRLTPGSKVLDVGTGSGYAAAVMGKIAREVYGIERHATLVDQAAERLSRLGITNVHVRHGDGTLGWQEQAPFDAIMVGAAGPAVPASLKKQLKVGGRLVIPVGETPRVQKLLRITRTAETAYREEDLGAVQFVPLIGEEGWDMPARDAVTKPPPSLPNLVARHCEPFRDIESVNLEGLLDRIGGARVVCLGEATHGTAEFYEMRARITRELIERRGFTIVALEADWPAVRENSFERFPEWMWANRQYRQFRDWVAADGRAALYGLDLYSMHQSIEAVLRYLEHDDPEAARVARQRYGCLEPWEHDPSAYGAAVLSHRYRSCEDEAVEMLAALARQRFKATDLEQFFDAERNAQLVANAERYYRVMYQGSAASWNLRDEHMFATLQAVMDHKGPESRAVVWAHNSHLGDASWTEMSSRGEHNFGQLARSRYGEDAYLVGFGTDHGIVAAASSWGGRMELKEIRPSHERSYEHICHRSMAPRFMLPLRSGPAELRRQLLEPRLERAIGVIYRPETELQSHYFQARLPRQFDEWIYFDQTCGIDR